MKKILSGLIAVLLLSSLASNAADILLTGASYGGTGCPQGTASVTLSPDQKTMSVLFDSYVAQAGSSVGKSLDRKTCNLAVSVKIPQGFSVSIFKVDYRGFASIPYGAEGKFSVEYFFAGQRGPLYTKTFGGGYNNDYLLNNQLAASALVWSACGANTNLRINSSMLAKTNAAYEDAYASVDSIDLSSGLIYHLQWRSC